MFCKKGARRNFAKFTGKHAEACKFIKKETLAQVFSCEFCEISKNIFTYRTSPMAASDNCNVKKKLSVYIIKQILFKLRNNNNKIRLLQNEGIFEQEN